MDLNKIIKIYPHVKADFKPGKEAKKVEEKFSTKSQQDETPLFDGPSNNTRSASQQTSNQNNYSKYGDEYGNIDSDDLEYGEDDLDGSLEDDDGDDVSEFGPRRRKERKSAKDFVSKTYHFDFLVIFFQQIRAGHAQDFSNEHEERLGQVVKSTVKCVGENNLHKILLSKLQVMEEVNLHNNTNNKNDFKYFTENDVITIPKEYLDSPYFCFFASFFLDSNGDYFHKDDKGLHISIPDNAVNVMAKFTVDVNQREMHLKIQQQQEENAKKGIFAHSKIVEAVKKGRKKMQHIRGKNFDQVLWWQMFDYEWWFQSNILIDSVKTLKELDEAIEFASNHDFKMPSLEMEETELVKITGRKEKVQYKMKFKKQFLKEILKLNKELWKKYFPDYVEGNHNKIDSVSSTSLSQQTTKSNKSNKSTSLSQQIIKPKKGIQRKPSNKQKIYVDLDYSESEEIQVVNNGIFVEGEFDQTEHTFKKIVSSLNQTFKIATVENQCLVSDSFKRLLGINWLDDEVINFYIRLISKKLQDQQIFLQIHSFM